MHESGRGPLVLRPTAGPGRDTPGIPGMDSEAEPDPTPPVPTTTRAPHELRRARAVARVLDNLIPIPGTPWRVGLDPLIGLIPGVGDWIGWVASLHLLGSAARAGADGATLVRMAANLVLDALAGAVPVIGDAFDMAWKANDRNLRLLERIVANPEATRRASRLTVGGVIGGTVALLVTASVGAFWILRWVLATVAGAF